MDFLRASGGITSKTALGESEEGYLDLRASGYRVTQIRITRGLGVLGHHVEVGNLLLVGVGSLL